MILTAHVQKQDQRSLTICQGHTAQEGVELKSKPWSELCLAGLSSPNTPSSQLKSIETRREGKEDGGEEAGERLQRQSLAQQLTFPKVQENVWTSSTS